MLREFAGAFILPIKGHRFMLAPDSLSKIGKSINGGLLYWRYMIAHCLFCDRPFEPKNKNHKFCNKSCGYCFNRGGTPFRKRGWYWSDAENRLVKPEDEKPKYEKPKERKKPKEEIEIIETVKDDRRIYRGYIYLMQADNGLYKIGRARNIQSRLQGLNREIPIKVECIHFFATKNYIAAEKFLHNKYADQRIKYEWFSLDDDMVEEIKRLTDGALDDL